MAIFAITVPCATPTTTTTTTVAPITFTATPSCVGGSGQIAVTNYAGGNGSYEWIAISSISRIDATIQAASGTRFAAGSSYTFSSLADGNYWVALRDTAGNTGATNDPGINIACTTTTTSTTTTTTTAAPTYTVRFFVKYNAANPISGSAFLDYSTDGTNYTPRVSINSSTCTNTPFTDLVNITAGTTIYIRTVEDASGLDIRYNAVTGSTCPVNNALYCAGGFSTVINANTDIAVNVYMDKARQYSYC
jgi:hypothetical protein